MVGDSHCPRHDIPCYPCWRFHRVEQQVGGKIGMDNNQSLLTTILIAAIPGMISFVLEAIRFIKERRKDDTDIKKVYAETDNIAVQTMIQTVEQLKKRVDEISGENDALRRENDEMALRIKKVEDDNLALKRANETLATAVKRLAAQVVSMGGQPVVEPKDENLGLGYE